MNKLICGNQGCKIPKTNKFLKSRDCSKPYCSNVCDNQHKCKLDNINESKPPINKTRKTSTVSRFIKSGVLLNEIKIDSLFNYSNFEIVKIGKSPQILGNGLYGDIFLAKNMKNNKLYAIKQVIMVIIQMTKNKIKESNVSEETIMNEISIHSKLVHDNIIRLYSFNISSDAFNLVTY